MNEGLNLNLVLSGATLVSVVGIAVKIWLSSRSQKVGPQPFEVRQIEEFITKRDLDHICMLRHTDIDKSLSRLERRIEELELSRQSADKRHEDRASLIHERVDRLTRVTYAIAGKLGINTED